MADIDWVDEAVDLNWDTPYDQKEYIKGKINRNIGMMRQWLNEERITDPKKLVSSEDLLYWINLK